MELTVSSAGGGRSTWVIERFLGGVLFGVVLGLVVLTFPFVSIFIAIGAAIGLAAALFRPRRLDVSRLAQVAGVLLGSGAAFLYGVSGTFIACQRTDNFCDNANIAPLLIVALAILGTGAVIASWTRRLMRR